MCITHLEEQAYELVSEFGRGTGKVKLHDAKGTALVEFVEESYEELDPSDKLLRIKCRRLTDL